MDDIFQTVPKIPTHTTHTPSQPTVTVVPDHPVVEAVTTFGHTTLWIVFALMLTSSVLFILLSWRVSVQKRLLYQITTFITIIATLSYYSMASGSGWTFRRIWETEEHKHDIPDTHQLILRQVFYARYFDWIFTSLLLSLDLAFLAGMNASDILNVVFADVIMTFAGILATFSHTRHGKWGWFVVGWIAFLAIVWYLFTNARVSSQKRKVQSLFVPLALYTSTIWALYLIIWALSYGSRRLSVNHEVLIFGILDILAKPIFGVWLLLAHRRTPANAVHLDGVWSEGFGHREGILRVGDDDEA